MKRRLFLFSLLTGTVLVFATWTTHGQAPGDAVPDHYIVSLAPAVNPNAIAANHGVAPTFVYRAVVNGFAGFVPPGRLRALQNDPRVMGVTPDRVVTAIAAGGDVSATGKPAGGGSTSSQVIPAGVTRIGAAPGSLGYTGAGVGVAVVDTGLDFNHSDLKPLGTSSFTAFGSSAQDNNGHGTHVGGTVAARNNSSGVVGVAPDATLYAVKVLDASGSGSDATVMAGFDWVAQNAGIVSPPIRVMNVSLGRSGSLDDNPALRASVQALHSLGITVVVAAGNSCSVEVSQQVPATYPEVLAVASTTALNGTSQYKFFPNGIPADTASYFTTDGAYIPQTRVGVTISAPGEDQENVSNGGLIKSVGILSTKLGGGTTRMSGTSMAAPHVTGVVALLYQEASGKELNGKLAPEDARTMIMNGADKRGSVPLASPTSCYTPDNDLEGVVSAAGAIAEERPVANSQPVTTAEDTPVTIQLTASDANNDPLTFTVLTQATQGVLSGTVPNLTYTPNSNFNGTDSFTFKVNDGGLDSVSAPVSITVTAVNDAPVAFSQSVSTAEDTGLSIVLSGTDVEGSPLTFTVVSGPANGTLSGTAPNLTYTPNLNFNGSDELWFKANDGGLDSVPAKVTITVTPVNDAPLAQSQSVSTAEDTAVSILLSGTDVEGSSLTFTVVSAPVNGTLSGAAPNLTYTPNPNFNGTDSFTFKANDGALDSVPATVTITVTAVNDLPVAKDDSYTTTANTALTVAVPGVLSNDTDADNDPLSAVLVTAPTNGSLTLNADGSFTYTPNAGFTGTDSFTYTANDATGSSNVATVTITVN